MARSRNIKPSFFTNDVLSECSFPARLLFAGLWVLADRDGRLEDRPKKIKGELFPHDNVDVNELLEELAQKRTSDDPFILRYEVNGIKYIQVLKFAEHQNPHVKEQASSIPAPDLSGASNNLDNGKPGLLLIPDSLISDSLTPYSPPVGDDTHEAVEIWNEVLGEGHPQIRKLTKPRKQKLQARLKDLGGLEGWRDYLHKIRGSPFLNGKNDRGWKADIDFALTESKMLKILEGSYQNETDTRKLTHAERLKNAGDAALDKIFADIDSRFESQSLAIAGPDPAEL